MKTIVVAYDETEPAKRALARAAELAKTFESKLIVTSVAPVGAAGPRGGGPIDPVDPPAHHREELEHARTFLSEQGIEAELQAGVGDAADVIVALAEERDADLIVVGTREPGVIDRLFKGSVSAAVSRQAHCDVLIVH
jgi:nucleotide-binding universal stress UspA family protein